MKTWKRRPSFSKTSTKHAWPKKSTGDSNLEVFGLNLETGIPPFFHKQAQARKGRNSIKEIKEESSDLRDFASIKIAASEHFENLYREDIRADHNISLLDAVPKIISPKINQALESIITPKEVKEALFAMEPDKAPGPDGFTPRFLQTCWQIIEKEFIKMIQKSQNCQKIGGCTNSAFLALIPKEKGANTFSRFHPISL